MPKKSAPKETASETVPKKNAPKGMGKYPSKPALARNNALGDLTQSGPGPIPD